MMDYQRRAGPFNDRTGEESLRSAQRWLSLVQVVLHDAPMPSLPVAFQCENIPFRPEMASSNSINRRQILGIELHRTNSGIGLQMRRVGCTNNDGGHSVALQHDSRGHCSN